MNKTWNLYQSKQTVCLTAIVLPEILLGVPMCLSDERVKCFARRCADLGKSLGVDVVDLYTLFHQQPVRFQYFLIITDIL